MIKNGFEITNKTKGTPTQVGVPFAKIKNYILGNRYELSLVFLPAKQSLELNRIYRKKNYIPNILSFSLSRKSGEIILQPQTIRKECSKFNLNYNQFLKLLFIHGLLHLKGFKHSDIMEKEEIRIFKRFSK